MTAFEATAPLALDLAGGLLDVWPLYLLHPGALAVGVALDRRVWCRVVTGVNGVRVESKDARTQVEARDVSELLGPGRPPLVPSLLRALGIEAGIHVTTRAPSGPGPATSAALAVSVAAAAARALGRSLPHDALWPIARDAETTSGGVPTGAQDYLAALHGGVVEVRLDAGRPAAARLATDPSRVEEHLLLVDAGGPGNAVDRWAVTKRRLDGDADVSAALDAVVTAAQRLRAALVDGRYGEVAPLLRQEGEARGRLSAGAGPAALDRIAAVAAEAGGAVRPWDGGLAAVWVAPEARDALTGRLKDAGFKAAPARVDLRGLVVEAA